MLPQVQHFPDNYVDITTESGICSIIVWSHHILGLSVLVKIKNRQPCPEIRFGSTPAQIVIEFDTGRTWKDNNITLLSLAGEELLSLKPEVDEEKIQSSLKRPARGYANRILRSEFTEEDQVERLVSETSLIICAFAICVSKNLHRAEPLRGMDRSNASDKSMHSSTHEGELDEVKLQHEVPESAVLRAARMLFDQKLDKSAIYDYVQLFHGIGPLIIPPKSFGAILKECSDSNKVWDRIQFQAVQLASTIIAFSHVADLDDAADFPITTTAPVVMADFYDSVYNWDGESPILVENDAFFELVALHMLGDTGETDFSNVCLLSDRGWSMFITTLCDVDPSYMRMMSSPIAVM